VASWWCIVSGQSVELWPERFDGLTVPDRVYTAVQHSIVSGIQWTIAVFTMGGDYREHGGRVPQKILLGGRKGKRPPTIATSSKKRLFPFFLSSDTF